MSDEAADRPAVYTIPAHRSFADSLAAGLMRRFGGDDPLALAQGRILLPNNRAVRTVSEAFVRLSGDGLLLPRLIPIGDPELDDRLGGALDPLGPDEPPPAIDPLARLLALASLIRGDGIGGAEALRLAEDLGRTIDALAIEEVPASALAEAAADAPELAAHWQVSLDRLRAIVEQWPRRLAELGAIDLTQRRNLLLRRIAERWKSAPPKSFTVAAGITTAAPAVATLLARVARMDGGMVVLPGLSLSPALSEEEWEALGPDDRGRGEPTHPQFHLKLLLDRISVGRGEVQMWPSAGRSASPAARGRAVANAMTAADFSDKWSGLKPGERRLTGIRAAEFGDAAAEALGIALVLREAIETPGRTAALVTPDRMLARRVSSLLRRWGIAADDSSGQALSELPAGTLLLAVAAAAAEDLAPVPLLALLKHPLAGGDGEERLDWLERVRALDLALRGPRPGSGIAGIDQHLAGTKAASEWDRLKMRLGPVHGLATGPTSLACIAHGLAAAAEALAGERAWRGADGRMAADLLASLEDLPAAHELSLGPDDVVPALRQLLDGHTIRPPYGGHPRIAIRGLLEARLQQPDLVVLGGLNEGNWPALPKPDPWLAPRIRANLGLPSLEFRVGLSAHDFASAVGAPQVLVTRARREGRSPTVASRFWLRLEALTGGVTRDARLERLVAALDDPGQQEPAHRPQPAPPASERPRRISVTSVDRLKADPFAFYAQAMLALRRLEPVDADHSAAWKGSAVHEVLEQWLADDDCDPETLEARAEALVSGETIHPMLRALWAPRLMEAIAWLAEEERRNRDHGRRPLKAEIAGECAIGDIVVHGKADRIDRLADGRLAIVDYKTGKAPAQKVVDAGFSLQLGLLGLIARARGFPDVSGEPGRHEYWSLSRDRDQFGKVSSPDKAMGAEDFLAHAEAHLRAASERWLTGSEPFTAKLHPAYAPYGDYDQLMRLEEWYGRE